MLDKFSLEVIMSYSTIACSMLINQQYISYKMSLSRSTHKTNMYIDVDLLMKML